MISGRIEFNWFAWCAKHFIRHESDDPQYKKSIVIDGIACEYSKWAF